ncbi:MAG: type II toxin-antitoxin system prevent-host-death family antitoxin [Myxococcota bacterium]
MKRVSVYELKRSLSSYAREAAEGEPILVTRHGRPLVWLRSADQEHVHVGRLFGRASLRPALKRASRGRYLEVLLDDRRGREKR